MTTGFVGFFVVVVLTLLCFEVVVSVVAGCLGGVLLRAVVPRSFFTDTGAGDGTCTRRSSAPWMRRPESYAAIRRRKSSSAETTKGVAAIITLVALPCLY